MARAVGGRGSHCTVRSNALRVMVPWDSSPRVNRQTDTTENITTLLGAIITKRLTNLQSTHLCLGKLPFSFLFRHKSSPTTRYPIVLIHETS